MRYARIYPWRRTRRSRAASNGPDAFLVAPFSAGYTTDMFGFDLRQGQLSQQAIGVLVRPALPRALRIAKIDVDFGRQRKATMIRKFLSPLPGQGLIQFPW